MNNLRNGLKCLEGDPAALAIRPFLCCKIREVVSPVVLFHPAGVNHVGQIVFRVGEYKSRVAHFVSSIGAHGRLLGGRKVRGNLCRSDFRFASRQAYETFIKVIEPRAQHLRAVPFGIGGHKYDLKPIRGGGRYFLESLSNRGHLERAHVRAMGVPEKKQRGVSLGLQRKIERSSGRIRQRKFWFREGGETRPPRYFDSAPPAGAGSGVFFAA